MVLLHTIKSFLWHPYLKYLLSKQFSHCSCLTLPWSASSSSVSYCTIFLKQSLMRHVSYRIISSEKTHPCFDLRISSHQMSLSHLILYFILVILIQPHKLSSLLLLFFNCLDFEKLRFHIHSAELGQTLHHLSFL